MRPEGHSVTLTLRASCACVGELRTATTAAAPPGMLLSALSPVYTRRGGTFACIHAVRLGQLAPSSLCPAQGWGDLRYPHTLNVCVHAHTHPNVIHVLKRLWVSLVVYMPVCMCGKARLYVCVSLDTFVSRRVVCLCWPRSSVLQ